MPDATQVEKIAAQQEELQRMRETARKAAGGFQKLYLELEKKDDFDLYSNTKYWKALIHREALIKIANIIEGDLRLVTTFSALTSARYLLEMLIWLRLIQQDEEKYISYFIALKISEQIQHVQAMKEQAERECDTYRKIGAKQDAEIMSLREKNRRNVSRVLDKYSISEFNSFFAYERVAKIKGFSVASKYLETKVIVECNNDLDSLEKERIKAKSKRRSWPNEKWFWNKKAEESGLKTEYDHVYGYISRLVHCKPNSFVINQKNIEYTEMIMFVRFILYVIRNILKIANPVQHEVWS